MHGVDHALAFGSHGLDRLKRDLLFFKSVFLIDAHEQMELWRNPRAYVNHEEARLAADELEFLLSNGLVKHIDINADFVGLAEAFPKLGLELDQIIFNPDNSPDRWRRAGGGYEFLSPAGVINDFCRMHAVLRTFTMQETVASCRPLPHIANQGGLHSATASDVLHIALHKVPVPGGEMPWDDIIYMREDQDLAHRAQRLMLASEEISKSASSLPHAKAYVEEMLYEYETYMKAHYSMLSYETVAVSAVGIAEIVEDLLKLKLGKLVGRLATVGKKKAQLTVAELEAPGRALSWVPAATKHVANRRKR